MVPTPQPLPSGEWLVGHNPQSPIQPGQPPGEHTHPPRQDWEAFPERRFQGSPQPHSVPDAWKPALSLTLSRWW